jgi:proline iminopeptidase
MKTLYPEIEPFDSGRLKVSEIHEIYYERVGNPDGIPVVFLHGGPGIKSCFSTSAVPGNPRRTPS